MNVITIVQRDKSRSTREVIHFEISLLRNNTLSK